MGLGEVSDNLDPDARDSLEAAYDEAGFLGHDVVGTEHLLLGLVRSSGHAGRILASLGVDASKVRAHIVELRGERGWASVRPTLTRNLAWVMANAALEAAARSRADVRNEDLLLVLVSRDGTATRILTRLGVELIRVDRELRKVMGTYPARSADSSPRTALTVGPQPAPRAEATVARTRAHVLLPVREASTLVLTGTAEYGSRELAPIPHVPRNIADLAAVLTTGPYAAFDPARVHVFADLSGNELPAIADLARDTADTFVLYYSGHGLTDARGDLYLCHTGTRPEHVEYTAVEYEKVRRILLSSPAHRKLVILDCCHAGRAVNALSADGLAGVVDIRGAHVLAAAAATRKALAPPDEEHTAFTAVLLEVLRDGVDPASELIHLAREFPRMAARLRASGRPVPQQSLDGAIAEFAIARNPRWGG